MLCLVFLVFPSILTMYVSISGNPFRGFGASFSVINYDFDSCNKICDDSTDCQAFYFNNSTMNCTTYNYQQLASFTQQYVSPVTEIFSFKVDITNCSDPLALVYYKTLSELTYSYNKTGDNWVIYTINIIAP
ncbi:unnamed protein product [Caenorhabditis angaria]|uniref:Apple domain-containing protein n=1 Tax=Caenorhabditis angaria TaxID=860376 RepID=A0A9P1IDR5_9PELO|nr:unnamed protein product [Caenorhabditis angaria]